jgi:hypothetical protein
VASGLVAAAGPAREAVRTDAARILGDHTGTK